eukprot:1030913-Amphidinium_carterae.1
MKDANEERPRTDPARGELDAADRDPEDRKRIRAEPPGASQSQKQRLSQTTKLPSEQAFRAREGRHAVC